MNWPQKEDSSEHGSTRLKFPLTKAENATLMAALVWLRTETNNKCLFTGIHREAKTMTSHFPIDKLVTIAPTL